MKCYKAVSTDSFSRWFWSSQLLFAVHSLVLFAFSFGHRRQIKSLWRFVLLGFLCAISVASPLFLSTGVVSDTIQLQRTPRLSKRMALALSIGLVSTFLTPLLTDGLLWFRVNLITLHVVLMVPFLPASVAGSADASAVVPDEQKRRSTRLMLMHVIIAIGSFLGHASAFYRVLSANLFNWNTTFDAILKVCLFFKKKKISLF